MDISRSQTKIGIKAPKDIKILRTELLGRDSRHEQHPED